MDRTCIRELEKIWLPDGYLVHNPITFISVEAGGKRGEKNVKNFIQIAQILLAMTVFVAVFAIVLKLITLS